MKLRYDTYNSILTGICCWPLVKYHSEEEEEEDKNKKNNQINEMIDINVYDSRGAWNGGNKHLNRKCILVPCISGCIVVTKFIELITILTEQVGKWESARKEC